MARINEYGTYRMLHTGQEAGLITDDTNFTVVYASPDYTELKVAKLASLSALESAYAKACKTADRNVAAYVRVGGQLHATATRLAASLETEWRQKKGITSVANNAPIGTGTGKVSDVQATTQTREKTSATRQNQSASGIGTPHPTTAGTEVYAWDLPLLVSYVQAARPNAGSKLQSFANAEIAVRKDGKDRPCDKTGEPLFPYVNASGICKLETDAERRARKGLKPVATTMASDSTSGASASRGHGVDKETFLARMAAGKARKAAERGSDPFANVPMPDNSRHAIDGSYILRADDL